MECQHRQAPFLSLCGLPDQSDGTFDAVDSAWQQDVLITKTGRTSSSALPTVIVSTVHRYSGKLDDRYTGRNGRHHAGDPSLPRSGPRPPSAQAQHTAPPDTHSTRNTDNPCYPVTAERDTRPRASKPSQGSRPGPAVTPDGTF